LHVLVAPLVGKQAASVRLATARLCIWEGSVRSSKTICSLIAWLKFVREAPAGNLLMTGKTERTLKRNILDPLVEMLGEKRCRIVAGSGEVWLLGRRVYLAGANDERAQEKIRGLTLIGAYVDEASTVPQSFWTMLLSRLSLPGARAFATTNPDSPGHWLKRDYLDRARTWLTHAGELLRSEDEDRLDLARFSFRLADNPHLPADYVESLSREFVGLWRKRFIEGLWVAAEGAVYDMFDEDLHVVDVVPPVTQWLCAAVDYGTTNPFHAVLLGIGAGPDPRTGARRDTLYGVSEWRWDSRARHRQLTDVEYSGKLREWLASVRFPGTRLHGPAPQFLVIDPSAASFKLQAYRDGWNTADGDNAVLDGIRLVSSLLGAGRLKLARAGCPALIEEFPAYSWDDRAALMGEDAVVKVGDHGLDALRYGVKTTHGLWQSRIRLAA
jgi:PBSX family phage terminase large subunit